MIIRIKQLLKYIVIISALSVLLIFTEQGRAGASNGMILCAKVIIPSLLPFSTFIIILMRLITVKKSGFLNNFSNKVFGLNTQEFMIFIFSMIGGYPIGAGMLSDLYSQNKIDRKKATLMQCFCINGGPAFMIMAIGTGLFSSRNLGIVLFFSSVLSSVFLAVLMRFFYSKESLKEEVATQAKQSFSHIFIDSIHTASTSVFTVCVYVILFSSLNSCLIKISEYIKPVGIIKYLTEITSAVGLTRNVYIISFLLGFAGFCIWLQIYALSENFGMNIPLFAFFRILHGLLNCLFTYLLLKIFNVTVLTISNNITYTSKNFYTTPALAFSLLCMVILLCLSVTTKKSGGNILKDVL